MDSRVGIDYINSIGFRELARSGNASRWLTHVFGRRSCDTCDSFRHPGGFLAGPVQSFAAMPGMKAPHQAWLTFQTDGSFGFFSSPSRNNVPGGNIWMLSPGALWGFSLRCRTETEDAPIRGWPLWHMMHQHPPIADSEVKIRPFNMQCEIRWRFYCMIGNLSHSISFLEFWTHFDWLSCGALLEVWSALLSADNAMNFERRDAV